jgi:uncharacterized protein YndB with AHSA1/START domain
MAESIRVTDLIPASPESVYAAWLDAEKHSAFTGSRATTAGVGGPYTAWDGYIQGTTLEALPGVRIVQSWRTTEFPAESPPSRLEIILEAEAGGTRITLVHSEIPDGQASSYEQGWKDHYFTPMKHYFGNGAVAHADSPVAEPIPAAKPAKKKAAPKKAKRAAPKRKPKKKAKVKAKARGKTKKKAKPAKKRSAGKSTRKSARRRR